MRQGGVVFLFVLLWASFSWAQRANVVLITIDALRPDHLSCYGYERKTSPHIDEVAEEGVVFTNALAASSWTGSSVASLLTSLYTLHHGLRDGMLRSSKPGVVIQQELSPALTTVAEAMKEEGYHTFGIVSNLLINEAAGFGQGFDRFLTLSYDDAQVVNERVKEWAPEIRRARPFFLWVHYFDPHWEYYPRKPWIDHYDPDYEGPEEELYDKENPRFIQRRLLPLIATNPHILRHLQALYDSEINFVDEQVGELLALVAPRGEETVVIITADHGEAFLEHGKLEHGHSLFEEEIRVPLVMRFPSSAVKPARRVEEPVSLIDIGPTILDLVQAKGSYPFDGASFLHLLKEGGDDGGERPLYSELSRFSYHIKALRGERWKLIWDMTRGTKQLFDLMEDPAERVDKGGQGLAVQGELEEKLGQWTQDASRAKKAKGKKMRLDEETIERLKSLGYLN